ncbi:hypothetical protein EIZ47_05205 [Chryseobacterium lacus]|uniref:Uncharacterized protein n=1 Tax=Chryseobacterium lacus TaxID=2058346 RepID=A0A368N000_9FLAO|nr:hypothetical protein [Chryseobacterium lacus]RCU43566.1 hypothetical protein DQ356_05250 [Chryseobacterium lacus]RST28580.1 hypothetical protein EIZ47_05205 [Chryseobacterium lacus]
MRNGISLLRKSYILLAFLFSQALTSQVLEKYPNGQQFYKNGTTGMMLDMIKIVKEKNIQKCKSKEEYYDPAVLVYPDGKIDFVKDFDTLRIKQRQCAYDFTKAVLPHMKGWIPAKIDGKEVKAIAKFSVFPFIIFNSKLNPQENVYTSPTFSDGVAELHKKISIVLTKDVTGNTNEPIFILFLIDERGKLKKTQLFYTGDDAKKIHKVSYKLQNISGDWAPATFNSVPFEWFIVVTLDPLKKQFQQNNTIRLDHVDRFFFERFNF